MKDEFDEDALVAGDESPPFLVTLTFLAGFASVGYLAVDALSHKFDEAMQSAKGTPQEQVIKAAALNADAQSSIEITDDGVVITIPNEPL